MTNETKYDFQDGNGPVAAHQHPNGGGWVADTAYAADTAYVGPNAKVSGNAQVYGNAMVSGNAQVFGDATVYGNAKITNTLLTANRSDGYTFSIFDEADGTTRITAGCRFFTIPEAIEHWTKTRSDTKLGQESISIIKHLEYAHSLKDMKQDDQTHSASKR